MVRIKDPVSGGLHLLAAILAVVGLLVLLRQAIMYHSTIHLVAYAIFGASMILLYAASSVHHLIPKTRRQAKLYRRIDHAMIFVLIAGTYTPICLISLQGSSGWLLLGIVWLLSLIGVGLKVSGAKVSRRTSTALYVGIGWAAIGAIVPIIRELSLTGFFWMLAGGIFYTIGALVYAYRTPNPVPRTFGFHEIFHLFVMAGSTSHFWTIFHYVR